MLVSTFAIANEPGYGSTRSGIAVVKKSETAFSLFYQSASSSDVKVSIFSDNGRRVFFEFIRKTSGFVRPYNLRKLGNGEYTVLVDDGTTKQSEKIRMGEALKLKAARVVQLEDNKFMLTIRSDISPRIVKVKIYDGTSLIHTQTSEITADFGQVFNVKKINESISFVVTDSLGNQIN